MGDLQLCLLTLPLTPPAAPENKVPRILLLACIAWSACYRQCNSAPVQFCKVLCALLIQAGLELCIKAEIAVLTTLFINPPGGLSHLLYFSLPEDLHTCTLSMAANKRFIESRCLTATRLISLTPA